MVSETELRIIDAARKVFIEKGLDGARMQEIADVAGINKAMLHYYFRTKEKLFIAIVKEAFAGFFPDMMDIAQKELTIRQKIEIFIERYLQMIERNPYLPVFMVHAAHRSPQLADEFFSSMGQFPSQMIGLIGMEMENGNLPKGSPHHFLINMVSMLIFPIVGRPILQHLYFGNDATAYDALLKERKEEIVKMIFKE